MGEEVILKTAKEIVKKIRKEKDLEIEIPATMWDRFEKDCVKYVGDCRDIQAKPDFKNKTVILYKD